ncbi:MerR family transcriptional regulator [Ferdinandcohnia quinoae]|uniref:MerR family transcriptional regulator n=1 Tax=Fredinandcohnia quinoae TaxID=2918902 RepID=A0AAW5EA73_9BACI|nr:MerR family transcriptional regulator [Fredinandcohnia sp. SECRCQ15]MCH1626028.1 MerR family transcriptional regulator [Fredinandcohnia sp. SECRCQ15]
MYTVGQVANFLGVTRDTLKYYEEKELVKPKYDENGYRKYNQYDIHDVITTNFYRELDIEIKKIQEIRQSKSLADLEDVLVEKEAKIIEEMEYKKLLLRQISSVRENCSKIKLHLGKFTVKEMRPLEVKGEIADFTAYNEYEIIRNSTESLKKAVTLMSVRRVIHFDEEGKKEDRFIVVKEVEEGDKNLTGEVLAFPKCIYTVIENGRAVTGGKNIDNEVGERLLKIAQENGYKLLGIAYINILLTTYEEGLERVFVEMYSPISACSKRRIKRTEKFEAAQF